MMVRFRMFRINVEQFAILAENAPAELDAISMKTQVRFKVAREHKVAPVIKFTFEKDGSPILLIEASCEFDIHPDDWSKMVSGDTITVSKEVLEFVSAQTVGTTRGILFCKTGGTPFSTLIIPPVNIASMIKGSITVDIPEETSESDADNQST